MGVPAERMVFAEPQMPQGGMGQPAAGSLQNQPAASEAAGSVAEPKPAETPDGTENGNLPSKEDYDRIWKAVFEDGEASKGSFYIIGSGAELTAVEEHSFTITVRSGHVKAYAERNRELLESLMARHTGQKRSLRIAEAGNDAVNQTAESVEDIAQEAGKLLGINVEIK